ncbi:hypothetical protein Tco_1101982, partial [Tanacetum coccineum]
MSESDGTLNDDTPRVDVAEEVVSPSVVDDTVEKEKLSSVVTTTESYPPLPTQITTSAGNAPVWVKLHGVPVMALSEDALSVIATKLYNIVAAMPKITEEGYYTCNIRVEYEWKPL